MNRPGLLLFLVFHKENKFNFFVLTTKTSFSVSSRRRHVDPRLGGNATLGRACRSEERRQSAAPVLFDDEKVQRRVLPDHPELQVSELHRLPCVRPEPGARQVHRRRQAGPGVQASQAHGADPVRRQAGAQAVPAADRRNVRREKSERGHASHAQNRARRRQGPGRRPFRSGVPRVHGRRPFRPPRAQHETPEQSRPGKLRLAVPAAAPRPSAHRPPELVAQPTGHYAARPRHVLGLDGRGRDRQLVDDAENGFRRFEDVTVRNRVPEKFRKSVRVQKQAGN